MLVEECKRQHAAAKTALQEYDAAAAAAAASTQLGASPQQGASGGGGSASSPSAAFAGSPSAGTGGAAAAAADKDDGAEVDGQLKGAAATLLLNSKRMRARTILQPLYADYDNHSSHSSFVSQQYSSSSSSRPSRNTRPDGQAAIPTNKQLVVLGCPDGGEGAPEVLAVLTAQHKWVSTNMLSCASSDVC